MLSKPDFIQKNIIVAFSEKEEWLSVKNDNIIVKNAEGEIVLQQTCYRVFAVWIVGHCIITSGLLEKAKKIGFSIFVFNHGFRPLQHFISKTDGNTVLRKIQYTAERDLEIAKYLIENKMINQLSLLKGIRNGHVFLKDSVKSIEKIIHELPLSTNSAELMGREGSVSKIFFMEWFMKIEWNGRKPRAKTDVANVLLDIGYTILFNYIEAFLNLYGFDIYCGVYHKFFYQRKSLVCDLVEPFRCIIDLQLKNSYNLGQIKTEHFKLEKGKYILEYKYSKHYTNIFLSKLLEYKVPIFEYVQQYYRCVMNNRPIELFPQFKIK